jgi:glycosyltransferase involved in cell wall biosynthesis
MAHKTEEFWGKDSFRWGKLLNPFKIPEIIPGDNPGEFGLYFGRLIDVKGVDILVEALRNCRDIPFKIVGDGPDFEKLKLFSRMNDLSNVEFTGAIWGNALNDIISRSKFVVVPSIWHENFPYVILQAFAAGKPVIGSNRGGIPELVLENERGLQYNADNAFELADKMTTLFNNDENCLRMGKNARKFIEDTFSDELFYKSLMNNYNTVLK